MEPSESTSRENASFFLFAWFWALAVLTHQAFGGLTHLSAGTLLTVAMVGVLLKPSSVRRFLLLAAVQVAVSAYEFPQVTNHWVLFAFANAWLLLATLVLVVRERKLPAGRSVLEMAAPTLRVMLVLVYSLATLHKLNWAFFDPAVSCATSLYSDLQSQMPVLPSVRMMGEAPIYGTLLLEGALPVLLLIPRTRPFGWVLGTLFHVVLGMLVYFNFSGVMLALYVLFLPSKEVAALGRNWLSFHPTLGLTWGRIKTLAGDGAAWPIVGGAAVLLAAAPDFLDVSLWRVGTAVKWVWWTVSLGTVALYTAMCFLRRDVVGTPVRLRTQHALAYLPLAGLLFTGVSPYLGLQTESSFSMFSNLQTENGHWNHIVVPSSVRLFPFQDDLVTVVESTDPQLRRYAEDHTQLVYSEFQRTLAGKPEAAVRYRLAGVDHAIERAGDAPELSQPTSLLASKLMRFRPVPPASANACQH